MTKAGATNVVEYVLDASVTLAWCFDDEQTPLTRRLLMALRQDDDAIAPALWPLEVANGLLIAERRGRLTVDELARARDLVLGLDVALVGSDATGALGPIATLARRESLTIYDASYLDLAMRENMPLATMDAALRRAARRVGVRVLA